MKIEKIKVEKFRHIDNATFEIGECLTIIAGGNGTGKTSLLGLIGHIFKFGRNPLLLNGKKFETKFGDVFKFSPEKDFEKEYKYSIEFRGSYLVKASSRSSKEKGNTRFRIDVGGRQRGGGKIKKPVIYLSLRRLIPLAQENTIKLSVDSQLTQQEIEQYNKMYNYIFASDDKILPIHTRSSNKIGYLPTSELYDPYGISAGQDNIGQIIIALIEFSRLKNNLSDYDGGVFLIDEIDATLYPAAQKNLVRLLHEKALELDLQVIFTTHSSDILNYVISNDASRLKSKSNFVSLSNSLGKVIAKEGFGVLKELLAELNHEVMLPFKLDSINVYFEDDEARLWFKSIVSNLSLECNLNLMNFSLGCGTYMDLLKRGFQEFDRCIVVLDGDSRKEGLKEKNLIFLPGDKRPENMIKYFLDGLNEDDAFWNNEIRYTKTVFRQGSNDFQDDREVAKRWFKKELSCWGSNGERVFKRWIELNNIEYLQVRSSTALAVKYILENNFRVK